MTKKANTKTRMGTSYPAKKPPPPHPHTHSKQVITKVKETKQVTPSPIPGTVSSRSFRTKTREALYIKFSEISSSREPSSNQLKSLSHRCDNKSLRRCK